MAKTTIPAGYIAANAITSTELAANSVTAAAIASGAILSIDIGANSVSSTAIAANAVDSSEIASNAVGTSQIAGDAVTAAKIADNAVGSDQIAANAVGSSEVASNAIGTAQIASNSVGIDELNVSDGTNGQYLQTNGSGTLSFSTVSGYTDSDVETYLNTSAIYTDATNDRLGIGTSSPESTLHINAGNSANLLIKSDGTYNIQLSNKTAANGLRPIDIEAQELTISTNGAGGSGSTERVIIDASGNVGIGLTVPDATLEVLGTTFVNSSTANRPAVVISGSYGGALGFEDGKEAGFYAQDSGDTFNLYVGRTLNTDAPSSKIVQTWKSSGNVGIGHDTPQFRLTLPQAADDSGKIGWEDGSSQKRASILCNSSNDRLEFRTGTSDTLRMSIHGTNEDIHIGENTSDVLLYMGSNGGAYGGNSSHWMRAAGTTLMWNSGGASGNYVWEINGSAKMKILSDGEVISGTTSLADTYSPLVNGFTSDALVVCRHASQGSLGLWRTNTMEFKYYHNGMGYIMTFGSNGVISGDFNDTSDRNLKENIVDLEGGLSVITQLRPRNFDWKKEAKANGVAGFIAQEVEEILPNEVFGNDYIETESDLPEDVPADNGKHLNYNGILAHAVKAIQEQQVLIEQLQAEVALLKGE